jgi:hypothetical protein
MRSGPLPSLQLARSSGIRVFLYGLILAGPLPDSLIYVEIDFDPIVAVSRHEDPGLENTFNRLGNAEGKEIVRCLEGPPGSPSQSACLCFLRQPQASA